MWRWKTLNISHPDRGEERQKACGSRGTKELLHCTGSNGLCLPHSWEQNAGCHPAISELQEEVLSLHLRHGCCPDRSLHGFSSPHAHHDDRNKDRGPLSPMTQSLLEPPVLLSWPSPNQAACTSVADRRHQRPLFGHSTPREAKGP